MRHLFVKILKQDFQLIHGEEEASCLGKHLFPEESADSLLAH